MVDITNESKHKSDSAKIEEADFYDVTINCGSSHKMDEAIEIARHYAKKYDCVVTINAYNSSGISMGKCVCLPNGGVWG